MSLLGCMAIAGRPGPKGEPGLTRTFHDFICDGNACQDVQQVQHLLRCVLQEVRHCYPHVREVTLQTDNASCFASGEHVSFIHALNAHARANHGIVIKRWAYTEAQTGKSALDTHFSFVQGKAANYVSSGGTDLLTCKDVFKALKKDSGIQGTTTVLVNFNKPQEPKQTIPLIGGISKIHDVLFLEDRVELRRFLGIDDGMLTLTAANLRRPDLLLPKLYRKRFGMIMDPLWSSLVPEEKPVKPVKVRGAKGGNKGVAVAIQAAVHVEPSAVPRPAAASTHRAPALDADFAAREWKRGWADKETRNNQTLGPRITAELRAMQRAGKGGTRITPEEAYQRVKWDLDIGKDGAELLQLTIPRVQAVMRAEWNKSVKEHKAAAAAAAAAADPAPKGKGKGKAPAKPAPAPSTEYEYESEDEVDRSLNDYVEVSRILHGNTTA